MTSHDVVIVGAGPTGMMLAGELALAGIDVAIVERLATQDLVRSRGLGLNARTLEVFDQRGIAEQFLAEGKPMQTLSFAGVALDLGAFPTRFDHGLALEQVHTERILASWIATLPVAIYRGCEVTTIEQSDDGVLVNGEVRSQYLVGCDGGRSIVRKSVGIAFEGSEPTTSWLMADVAMTTEPPWGVRYDELGTQAIGKSAVGRARVVLAEATVCTDDPTLQDVSKALVRVYGTDFGASDPLWTSRFTDMIRQATTYRCGRVLIAGDAAHVHPPQGGQGLNLGIQDAVNLGWKLARVVDGGPDRLLDSYDAERRPVGARVLRNAFAQAAISPQTMQARALREAFAELLEVPEARDLWAGMLSGLALRYDLGEGHPLLGRRMPDLDLDDGRRVFELLHAARPVLLVLGPDLALDTARWEDRMRVVRASYTGAWELPVLGTVPAPPAVLIRPDGHVAWAGDSPLEDALARWCA